MQKIGKRKPVDRLKQCMDVIRHDNEAVEEVALAVEMPERARNNLRRLTIAQETGAVTLIEPALAAFDESLLVFVGSSRIPRFRMMPQPVRKLFFPLGAQ